MFNKEFPARLRSHNESLWKGKKNAAEKKVVLVRLQYDFTPELAANIGGDAPAIQAMLAKSNGEASRLTTCGLHLDTREVAIRARANAADELAVDNTLSLTARAHGPAAEGTGPVLEVAAGFELDEEDGCTDTLPFLHRNLGATLDVRMDRKQLELPVGGDDAE